MKKFLIADKTLKVFAADKNLHLSFSEKTKIAGCIDDIRTDIIEIPAPANKTDEMFIKTLAVSVKKSAVAVDTGYTVQGVKTAYECIKDASKPILNVSFPVSVVQMEYICHMKPAVALKSVAELISVAKATGAEVEFTAEDAARAESKFLYEIISAAIEAGADIISLSDEAANFDYEEYGKFISDCYENVPSLKDKTVIVDISDEIDMSTACLYAAVKIGVDGVKVAAGATHCCEFAKTVDFLKGKADQLGISLNIYTSVAKKNIETVVAAATAVQTEASHDMSSFAVEEALSADSGFDAVCKTLETMGYDLSDADKQSVFAEFSKAAAKKSSISVKELDAIVASSAMRVPATYELLSYVINAGNVITATANISIEKDGKTLTGVYVGDGPVDAAFNAIEMIIGHHYELVDFQVQAVTEGRQALGRSVVCLRSISGKLFSGVGISTDVIGASITAYIDALNKIAFEENK